MLETLRLDVTDSAQVNALVEHCVDQFGKIDVVIANAGGGGVRGNQEFWEYPDDAFEIPGSATFEEAT